MNDFIEPCANAGEKAPGIGVEGRHPGLKDLMISGKGASRALWKEGKE